MVACFAWGSGENESSLIAGEGAGYRGGADIAERRNAPREALNATLVRGMRANWTALDHRWAAYISVHYFPCPRVRLEAHDTG